MTTEINNDIHTLIECGIFLWDEVTNNFDLYEPHLDSESHAARVHQIIGIIPKCEAAYQVAQAAGYDDAFDWEFCPAFLNYWLIERKRDPEEIGRLIVADNEAGKDEGRAENE